MSGTWPRRGSGGITSVGLVRVRQTIDAARMPRALLFDFDLTLADSTQAIVECMTHAFNGMSLPCPTPEAIARTIGIPLPQAFVRLCGDTDPAAAQVFLKHYHGRADQVMTDLTAMLPYAVETARALKARGIRTAIVSTKLRYRIVEVLERRELTDAFDVVIGGEDVTDHKPHPEGLQRALAQLRVEPSHAWYVGDHLVDAQAAVRAQISFVAVLTGMTTREDFAPYPVHHFLESMERLPSLVDDALRDRAS